MTRPSPSCCLWHLPQVSWRSPCRRPAKAPLEGSSFATGRSRIEGCRSRSQIAQPTDRATSKALRCLPAVIAESVVRESESVLHSVFFPYIRRSIMSLYAPSLLEHEWWPHDLPGIDPLHPMRPRRRRCLVCGATIAPPFDDPAGDWSLCRRCREGGPLLARGSARVYHKSR